MNRIKYAISLLVVLLIGTTSFAQPKIILDTDFGGDADDLGALAMLHHFHNRGEAELLAVLVWTTEQYAVPAIDAVNTFYGNPDIPIGVRKDGAYHETWNYSRPIADVLPHNETYDSAKEAVQLYRELLTKADDSSVTIVTVGPLKNIENLLNSEADSISELKGSELIEKKVKEFVIMGGEFPEGEKEWNFDGNMPGVTKRVMAALNVPITFLGYEVGVDIRTAEVFNSLETNHPLYVGFMHFSENASWINERFEGKILDNATYDQTAVLYAVRNGVGKYWSRVSDGICIPDDTGGNTWQTQESSNHSYLKLKMSTQDIASVIDNMMLGKF